MKMLSLGCASLISLSLVSFAVAQRPIDAGPVIQTTQDTLEARDRREANTAQLSAWLAMSNKSQVELAELALVKSDQPDVEKFAQMMIDDHTQIWKALQKFAPADLSNERNNTGTDAEQREIAAQNNNTMMLVGKNAATYELRMTKQLLEKYDGQDFDMGYLGQQMVAHVRMLATLEAMKNHGTDDFQQIVAGGIEKTRGHLQHAHVISRKLEDDRRNAARVSSDAIDNRPVDATAPFDPAVTPDRPLPDVSPSPQLELGEPDVETDIDIEPRSIIKEQPEIAPVPDIQVQP